MPLPTNFRARTLARDGRVSQRTVARRRTGTWGPSPRPPKPTSILRPILAGMATTALLLYASGWGVATSPGKRIARSTSASTSARTTTKEMETRVKSHHAGLPQDSRFLQRPGPFLAPSGRDGEGDGGGGGGGGAGGAEWPGGRGDGASGGGAAPEYFQLPGQGNGEVHITPPEENAGVGARGGAGGDAPERTFSDLAAEGTSPYFSESDVAAVSGALTRYTASARRTLEADEIAVREGRPLQGKYIVLDSGNELVNRLRGVLSGFFLGVVSGRVFVADITYQKDTKEGLLSALFEGPGYQWDLSKLSSHLRRALSPGSSPSFRGTGSAGKVLHFDMSEDLFRRWVCDDVLGAEMFSVPVVTLSTVVYPLPLLARNPTYASHPLLAGSGLAGGEEGGVGGGWEGFAGGGQARIEALETLLTRSVLRPTRELRERARGLAAKVRARAEEWGRREGVARQPPRVVGLHVRTYFVKAVSSDKVERNLEHFAECAAAGSEGGKGAGDIFYFVATDEAETQALARKVWGDGCFFEPFDLPGSKLEGIKAAFVDLLVMGSFDDYVMTPHSSFSELGSSLSHTWLPDPQASLRTHPNRPIVPVFPQMNDFEQRKVQSLLDRRAAPIAGVANGGACMRAHAAGMSVAVAKGTHLISMFEAVESAPCFKGRADVAHL